MALDGPQYVREEIESGLLGCPSCRVVFAIERGVPRLVMPVHGRDGQVKRSFELQWRAWGREDKIFGRTERVAMDYLMTNLVHPQLARESWRGKWVLDAGCGHGMYVRGLIASGAQVVGLDIGDTVTDTYQRVRQEPQANCLQADVLRPGLLRGSFDFVFSNGVIHHTGNTRRAFSQLAGLVRVGGYLGVWVYPVRHWAWELLQQAIRGVTTRLPSRLLYYLCYLPVPLLSLFRAYSGTSLRTATWRQCAQVVFDFYAPRYQTHHRPEEVQAWFREEGFEQVMVMPDPLSITGKRVRA